MLVARVGEAMVRARKAWWGKEGVVVVEEFGRVADGDWTAAGAEGEEDGNMARLMCAKLYVPASP